MTPIYNNSGAVIAWLGDGNVYGLAGHPLAFLDDAEIYSFDGTHRGHFEEGFVRDHNGDVVAFVEGAQLGPLLPLLQPAPLAPVPLTAPLHPLPELPPLPALPSLGWSALDLGGLVTGGEDGR